MNNVKSIVIWLLVALAGAIAFAMLALSRGEHVNAVWLVIAAVSCYSIAYRFYSLFIAKKVFELDDRRVTPAERHNDGLDYVPTNKWVLFGHHFAAIAGAGPLVGPILAAQMGFLPGTIWILVGVMFAGAVQDFLVLFISTRRDGRSLGEMAKQELGTFAGVVTMLGALGVMIIILSALALVVVKALAHSPWGVFTIAATIPIALFMGVYMRFLRPGKIAEVSLIGFVLMMMAIVYGGDISGFHALVSSGTTPKLIERESHIRMIGYGAMLMESFVAIMALICASVIDPGVYFAMNSPSALIGTTVEQASQVINGWGFMITPEALSEIAKDVGEASILSRAGGAPTFAVGMAHIITEIFNSRAMMAFWYHFAILFEALFILTAVDAGTRACRFMVQDLVGLAVPGMGKSHSWLGNMAGTTVAVAGWGFFVYQGVIDPLGGINTLWPLFGIGNQMLASMALILGTVVLFKMKKQRYAWVTILPTIWLFITSMTAGWQKIFHEKASIGFLAQAKRFSLGIEQGTLIAPAKTIKDMETIVFSNQINAALCGFFMLVAVTMLISAFFVIRRALASETPTAKEVAVILREETTHR
ncbi:carbon starvation CstA family protein [Symbiopectobacterium purcellii]|uniref:Carbon starvation protein A n=1 Tax=Symbiopectobacterium purcellii TaxID=2871826 RepID=A0ABX9AVK7_9ENTR|nr:carbon starvation CstA family protein [Symbiopectobacterium purcellii]QZN97464.1 carbon starvation protein A [Symbiopectobacterium purcellii]